jgi:hypothetical protein
VGILVIQCQREVLSLAEYGTHSDAVTVQQYAVLLLLEVGDGAARKTELAAKKIAQQHAVVHF